MLITRPLIQIQGARLQNGAQPEEQKRVLSLLGSGRNHTGVVAWLVSLCEVL